jgi:hypothetical protein
VHAFYMALSSCAFEHYLLAVLDQTNEAVDRVMFHSLSLGHGSVLQEG